MPIMIHNLPDGKWHPVCICDRCGKPIIKHGTVRWSKIIRENGEFKDPDEPPLEEIKMWHPQCTGVAEYWCSDDLDAFLVRLIKFTDINEKDSIRRIISLNEIDAGIECS